MQIQIKCVAVEQHGESSRLIKCELVSRAGYLQFMVQEGEPEYDAFQAERPAFAGRERTEIRDAQDTLLAVEPELPPHEAHDGLYTITVEV